MVLLDVQVNGEWKTVGASIDHTFDMSNDLVESTTKDSGHWKEFVEMFKEADYSLNGLQDPTQEFGREEIIDLFKSGDTKKKIRYGEVNSPGAILLECECLIESYSEGAPHDGLATWDLSLKMTGEPDKVTAPGS